MLKKAHEYYNQKNYTKALSLYQRLADSGNPDAMTSLGFMYQNGQGIEKNDTHAFNLYIKAAESEQPYALFNLGLLYASGQGGVEENHFKAFDYFQRSAIAGVELAQYETALRFERGLGCVQDFKQAAYWYEEAAKRGHAEAFNNLGVLYKDGSGVEQNYHRAFVCFSRASEKNLPVAQYNLGQLYDAGLGVEQNNEKALELCRQAAYGGHQKAKEIIKKLQENGTIVF